MPCGRFENVNGVVALCPWATVTVKPDVVTVKAPCACDALSIEKVSDVLAPPPGAGLKTATLAVPTAAKSAAGIVAVNCVALTRVVALVEPFQRTVAPETKPPPVTVKRTLAEPVAADIGDRPVIVGIAFGFVGATDTVMVPAT